MYLLDILIALAAGALVGLLVGRRTSLDRLRCRELEAELAAVRDGASRYREDVATHFEKTSELVKGLTLQYRTVYDHLADGARTLCPERMTLLSQGDAARALLGGGPDPAQPEDDAEPAPSAAAADEEPAAASAAPPSPSLTAH